MALKILNHCVILSHSFDTAVYRFYNLLGSICNKIITPPYTHDHNKNARLTRTTPIVNVVYQRRYLLVCLWTRYSQSRILLLFIIIIMGKNGIWEKKHKIHMDDKNIESKKCKHGGRKGLRKKLPLEPAYMC